MKRLYVGGLGQSVTQKDMRDRFGKFGDVHDVELRTKRDDDGVPVKTFGYINIIISDADLNKCMTVLNRSKWKGGTLQIAVAKESFLQRLAQEREDQDRPEPVNPPPRQRLIESLKNSGVENFHMKSAVPGTPVPGHEDWVVSKFGRVLPVLQLKSKIAGRTRTVRCDPSKHSHNLRRLEPDQSSQCSQYTPVSQLTWTMSGGDDEISRKRRGEFPPTEPWRPKKSRAQHEAVTSDTGAVEAQHSSVGELVQHVEEDTLEVVGSNYKLASDRFRQRVGQWEDEECDSADADNLLSSRPAGAANGSQHQGKPKTSSSRTLENGTGKESKMKAEVHTGQGRKTPSGPSSQSDVRHKHERKGSVAHTGQMSSSQSHSDAGNRGIKTQRKNFTKPLSWPEAVREQGCSSDGDSEGGEYVTLLSNSSSVALSLLDLQQLATGSWGAHFPSPAARRTPITPDEILASLFEEDEQNTNKKVLPLPASQRARHLLEKSEEANGEGVKSKKPGMRRRSSASLSSEEEVPETSSANASSRKLPKEFSTSRSSKEEVPETSSVNAFSKKLAKKSSTSRSSKEEVPETSSANASSRKLPKEFSTSRSITEEVPETSSVNAFSKKLRKKESSTSHSSEEEVPETSSANASSKKLPKKSSTSRSSEEEVPETSSANASSKKLHKKESSTSHSSEEEVPETSSANASSKKLRKKESSTSRSSEEEVPETSSANASKKLRKKESSTSRSSEEEVPETSSANASKKLRKKESSTSRSSEEEVPETSSANASSKKLRKKESSTSRSSEEEVPETSSANASSKKLRKKESSTSHSSEEEVPETSSANASSKKLPKKESSTSHSSEERKEDLVVAAAPPASYRVVDQEQQQRDNRKRLAALEQRQKEAMQHRSLIQGALANLDTPTSTGKRIVFGSDDDDDDDDDGQPDPKMSADATPASHIAARKEKNKTSGSRLFDSEDEDDEEETSRFQIKPQFEGRAGQKLMQMQAGFAADDRFKMDARFLENEEGGDEEQQDTNMGEMEENDVTDDDKVLQEEKRRNISILENVLNKSLHTRTPATRSQTFRDISALQYDPTKEEHAMFETKDDTEMKPSKKKKKTKMPEKVPEVSKETFYSVSSELCSLFGASKEEMPGGGEEGGISWDKEEEEEQQRGGGGGEQDLLSTLLSASGKRGEEAQCFKFSFFGDEAVQERGKQLAEYHVENLQGPKVSWQPDRFQDSSSEDEEDREDEDTSSTIKPPEPQTPSKQESFFFYTDDPRLIEGPGWFCRSSTLEEQKDGWNERRVTLRQECRKKHREARKKWKPSLKS